MFIIQDERHAELMRDEFKTFADALEELKRLALIPWDQKPNRAPCMSWKTCGRQYEIAEYDNSATPWKLIRRTPALSIRAKGVQWLLPEI